MEGDSVSPLREPPVRGIEQRDGCAVVRLAGELDLYNADDVRAALNQAIDASPAGTTFCLADGNYSTTAALNPKDGDHFIGVYTDGTQPNIANTGSGGVFSGHAAQP